MTAETVLTDAEIITIGHQARAIETGENGYILPVTFAREVEQAILQSDRIRTIQGMADCMEMVRKEFIDADLIDVTTPPTMIADLVRAQIWALRKDAARLDKLEADYFEPVEGGIRKHIDADMEQT